MSCCNTQSNNLRESLVENDSLIGASVSIGYGSSEEKKKSLPAFPSSCALLDPSGQLSEELKDALDAIFVKYSKGRLFLRKQDLMEYLNRCYPNLDPKYYDDRASYILSRYGQEVASIKSTCKGLLDSMSESKDNTVSLNDTYAPHTNRRKKEASNAGSNGSESVPSSRTNTQSIRSISIPVGRSVLEASLSGTEDPTEICLMKTKFLLLYRKASVDKPMMVRLELTELGHEQFRSGMVVDRTKQLDKLAFQIQQLRNRHGTHIEERKRIEEAESPKKCSADIESWIKSNREPLDATNDQTNLFRKRRPIKFPRICHSCCCCCVCIVRACE